MDYTATEAQVVFATRRGHRVRELQLMPPQVRGSRLSDGERHSPSTRVSGGQGLSFPAGDRVAIQVREARLVEKTRSDHPRVIDLRRPGTSRIPARDAGCAGAAHGVLGVIVEKPIDIH